MSMTENEAINELQANIDLPFGFTVSDEVSGMAIQALEEIQQYRNLGTAEEILKVFNNQQAIIATQHETLKQYRAIGTVEELLEFKEEKQNKCKDCAGCTSWLCECANERGEAIDEFAKRMKELVYKWIDKGVIAVGCIDEIAEQMKAGSSQEV